MCVCVCVCVCVEGEGGHLVIDVQAALVDAASGMHVRFRLGGTTFPPAVYYKVCVCVCLCVCVFVCVCVCVFWGNVM